MCRILSEFYKGLFSMHLSGTIQGVFHKDIFGSVNFCDIFVWDFHALLRNVAMFLWTWHIWIWILPNFLAIFWPDFTEFLMVRRWFDVGFVFEKRNSIVNFFIFLTEFILGTQFMVCPKLVYCCQNRPQITPAIFSAEFSMKKD